HEVQRNKLQLAQELFAMQCGRLALPNVNVPDHLFGMDGGTTKTLRKKSEAIQKAVKELHQELQEAVGNALNQISRSEDDVSKVLTRLFKKAVTPTPEEMERARGRKEKGNPPGK